ncbi:HNH endonuclease [Bacillus cereus]|uniref:HNH endonuclease n=1 Tax=Bacillus cereus TaxID=1396 RepID=UPI000BFE3DDB|nr:HNH endonuclease [Bacillus cereus]PGQ16779.1 hypothetical protein COA09_03730 [Bacillus cereus]PGS53596.1 hypothetical protein COC67_23170 [Bacillus cereus]PGV17133.1 hypothetical protein COD77_05025 [Bacillus cereus]
MKNHFKHNADGSTTIYYTHPKTGDLFETIIDTEDFDKVNSVKNTWVFYKNGKKVRVKCRIGNKHHYLYRYIMNAEDSIVVDHIDGNTLNNRKSNLRLVSQKHNLHNQKQRGNLPRNVNYNPLRNKYRVTFMVDGKRKSFGQYDTVEEAEKVAIEARRKFMPGSIK